MPTIKVTAKKGLLQFLVTKPLTVAIDKKEQTIPWGKTVEIPVSNGDHLVEAHFPYMGRPRGKISKSVNVTESGVALSYKTPFIVTSAGRLDVRS
jgi:hypothetical protein